MKKLSLGAHLYIVLVLIFTAFLVKGHRLLPTQHVPTSSEEGVSNIVHGQDISHNFKGESRREEEEEKEVVGMEQYPTGSSIPDCSHACGACFPCKRVMISFKCSTSIESCPIVYRCMCKGKYYHVPSN